MDMTATSPRANEEEEPAESRASSFDTLPLFVQSNILARLHWRDLISVSRSSKSLHRLAMGDDFAWEARCRERYREGELRQLTAADDDHPARAATWKDRFLRAVSRAHDAARRAAPLLTVEDNTPLDFRRFEEAQEILRGMSFEDVREFIATPPRASLSPSSGPSRRAPPTLLVLAGMVECLARAPVVSDPAEMVCALRDAGLGARKVRAQMWLLGRMEGVGFRLRDEVRVHEGSLEELAMNQPRVWETLLRGIKHEVRDMEIQVVGPPKKTFWSTLGAVSSADAAANEQQKLEEEQ